MHRMLRIERRGSIAFPLGIALVTLIGVAGCARSLSIPRFEFEIARSVEEAASLDPSGSVEARNCPVRGDRPAIVFRNALGAATDVWTDPESRMVVDARPDEILLTRYPGGSEPEIVFARISFEAADQQRLARYRHRHAPCRILISIDGEPTWLSTNDSDWSREIPIGVFERASPLLDRLVARASSTRRVEWPALEASVAATAESERRALERYACDAEFRADFERSHPGAARALETLTQDLTCPEAAD